MNMKKMFLLNLPYLLFVYHENVNFQRTGAKNATQKTAI